MSWMAVRESKIKMPVDRHFTRTDIVEIKIQIGKKLGNQKAEKYFGLLDRFFSLKLGKSEFDKLCIATVGRENLRLHNSLIKSILKNVLLSKAPPPKGNKVEKPLDDKVANGYRRTCLKSLCRDSLPPSPRRGRTPGFRDRRSKDCPSPLGPNGKPSNALSFKDLGQKALEQQSATELLSLGSQPIEANSVEDGEEVDQAAAISPGIHSRSPVLTPPFGIPWNGKGNRKVLSASLSPYRVHVETCYSSGELPDSSSLRKRLESKLEREGLGVSLDCVNLLNSGLDVFLKRLIKPSLELATSRIGNKQPNQMWHARDYQKQPMAPIPASMLDFRTAMELDPQILGEVWPVQLEKITLQHSQHLDDN